MRRAFFLCCVLCGGLITARPAGAQFGGGGFGGGQPVAPSPEEARPIQLEIAILNVTSDENPAKRLDEEQQLTRLERLETEGKLAGIQRLKLNLVANQQSQLQTGETVQMVVGRSMRPPGADPNTRGGFGGPPSEIMRSQQIGTMVQAIARPTETGALVEIKLERTGYNAPRPPAAPDAPPPDAPKTNQMTVSTTVALLEGENQIIGGMQSSKDGDKTTEETWVLARIKLGPAQKKAAAMLRIFQLQNIAAKDAVEVISSVFDRAGVRAVADPRTNTMLVVSAPDDTLQEIEAILQKLDQNASAPAVPQVRKLEPIPDETLPARKKPSSGVDPLSPGT